MKIHIKNGHVIDPKNNIDAKQDIYIAGVNCTPQLLAALPVYLARQIRTLC